jgi:aldose 1-epimerase
MVTKTNFGVYALYTIEAGELAVSITTLGATVTSLRYRGMECVPSYDSPEGYLSGTAYLGAAIGRYGNRIAGARFALNGKKYRLPANEGLNQLHGGPNSYDKREWMAEVLDDAVRFTLFSPDGDNGFPGALTAVVTYSVRGDTLRLDFEGDSDADTVYAPTSHMYFDLSGRKKCREASLQVNASHYLEVDGRLIPTEITPVEGTRFDFRDMRKIGQAYDHCFVLDGETACVLRDGEIQMTLATDLPALQVYTGEFLPAPFKPFAAVALEPESFPDSPNRPDFPSTVLRAGEHFHRWAEYRFETV